MNEDWAMTIEFGNMEVLDDFVETSLMNSQVDVRKKSLKQMAAQVFDTEVLQIASGQWLCPLTPALDHCRTPVTICWMNGSRCISPGLVRAAEPGGDVMDIKELVAENWFTHRWPLAKQVHSAVRKTRSQANWNSVDRTGVPEPGEGCQLIKSASTWLSQDIQGVSPFWLT